MSEEHVPSTDQENEETTASVVESRSEEDVLKDEIRRFTLSVYDSKLRSQEMVFVAVSKAVDRAPALPEPYIKGLVKLAVTASVRRFCQPESYQLVSRLLDALAKHDSVATARHLAHTIIGLFPIIPNVSESSAKSAVPSAKWLLKLLAKVSAEDFTLVLSAVASLSFYCCVCQKSSRVFERKLRQAVVGVSPDALLKGVTELAKDAAAVEKTVCLVSYLTKATSLDLATVFLDLFTKGCLLSKTRPIQPVVDICDVPLSKLTSEQFKDLALPNIKKALLRSPEVAMYGVRRAFNSSTFPLDSYSDEIVKAVTASLSSLDDELRNAAVSVLVALSSASQPPTTTKIIAKLFDQLSSAKSSEQRISLLEGVAACASTSAPSSPELDTVANDVISKTAKADKDTHEGTVAAQWDAAVAWANRLSKVTPALVAMFKDAPKLAVSVRSTGYRALAKIITARGMTSLPDGTSTALWSELDNAQKDALDAIGLTTVLLKTTPAGTDEQSKAWQKIANNDNLFKDKALTSMKWKDAVLWAELVERVVVDRPFADNSSAYPAMALKSLCLLLFWPHWEVRRRAALAVERILKIEESRFAEVLADVIYNEAVTGNIEQALRKVPQERSSSDWLVPGEWLVLVLRLLLTPKGPELDKLAIHTLLLASLPRLVEIDGSVWLRWIHGQDKSLMENELFCKTAIDRVLKCEQRNVRDNALITLVALNMPSLKAALWNHVEQRLTALDCKTYNKVTEKEVELWKCPDGVLYNKAALDIDEGGSTQLSKGGNVKEQKAEMQLRRELAEQKKKAGILTEKQKQAMAKELVSEKAIREEINSLYVDAESRLDEARAMVRADQHGAFARPYLLFDYGMPLTRSHLVSYEASQLFLAYRDGAFEGSEDYLDQLLGSTWLRVIGSRWYDEQWAGESRSDAVTRVFSLLNERAFVVDTGDDEDDALVFDEIVGAPQLTLLYPMIKLVLEGSYDDSIKEAAQTLLQNAIHKRFLKEGVVLQLPMLEYATLLLSYYSDTTAAPCLQALVQLVGLVNDTEDTGVRVMSMVRGALDYLCSVNSDIRFNVIKILSAPQLLTRLVMSSSDESFKIFCLVRVFIARFDDVEAVADAATRLWYTSLFHLKTAMGTVLIDECASPIGFLRQCAARAVTAYLEEFPAEMKTLLSKTNEVYTELYNVREAVTDSVGRVMEEAVDEYERRSGVSAVLGRLAELVDAPCAEQLVHMVVPKGLEDRNAACREAMCAAAVEAIRRQGAAILSSLLPFLERLSDNTPAGAQHDNLRQGLVVLLGSQAQYLEPSSEKVKAIVARLLEVLNTPSQSVQESVSRCLSPLVASVREDCPNIVQRLLVLLFNAETYGERRGAAYGIGGLVKGMGLSSLKTLNLITTIKSGLVDKKNWKMREGSLLALEILCSSVGKLFEPYMIQILPTLLICFGDGDNNVRKAAEDTARAMMSSMSAHGTKLVLPSITTALDDDSWRTKCAATELLGSMAFCAPKQLSACLPSVVPKLIEALADSSSKVNNSAEKALRQIARVVRNPEILGVTNQLMIGLLDPANKSNVALQAVLNTKFIHYIDAPSLALIMPIVRRAFEDRVSETRRIAAQIIANIYNLTENKDMEPYLANLVPGIQKSLLDPVPEIRTVAARALGSIVSKSTGVTSQRLRETIIPWLKEKLVSPQSNVDRSGAAQGLCEVLSGSGNEQLDNVMPEIIAATESPDVSPETRDGYILMYIYLPMVFGERFVPYLPKVVPPILTALADENEYVRASALKAGQRLIAQYCSHARRLLLPQLQIALIDDNWRIRYAAVQLIGDFLFTVSGVSGKSTSATADEDDTMGMEQAGKTIVRALGQQCRDRVLAGLYLARSDVALVVRQAAGHVWKIVVSNTPRTLKELMKTLFEMVVDALASHCEERQQMGARCLGELVRKMGDKIINEILPVLELNQTSEEMEKRVGVAVALHEIIDNMSKDVLNHYLSSLVPPVRSAICDDSAGVRLAGADTFSVLYRHVGHEALDEIITPLLEKLTPDQDHILEGLCQIMKQNSRQMLPYLLPRLTKPPVNVHALCSLAAVAGDSLSRQLPRVLDALLESCQNNDQYDPMIDPCEKVVIAVADEEGIPVLSEYLLQRAAKGNVPSAVLLHTFVDKSGAPLSELAEDLLPGMLQLYSADHPQIVDHAVHATIGVAQSLDTREMQEMIPLVKKTLNIMVSQAKGKPIAGFAHPKGLQPLLPMLREGILQGGVELKALAGETMGMVVGASQPEALKAHVVSITGPLIRVLGDRYPANVKLAILDTLSKLLDKVDTQLRPFLPQLQSTFVKALQEPSSRAVRLAAGGALARLLRIHPKPEPLVNELFKVLANSQDQSLMETTFVAARALVTGCAQKLSPATIQEGYRVCELTFSASTESPPSEIDTSLTVCSGTLMGELAIQTGDLSSQNIIKDMESCTKLRTRQAKAYAMQQMCHTNAAHVWSEENMACRTALPAAFTADPVTACAAIRAAANIIISDAGCPDRDLLSSIARAINHQSTDVRRVTASSLGHIFQKAPAAFPNDLLKLVIPQLVNGAKESNSAVRSASELALVFAFHSIEGQEKYDSYRSTVEGAVKTVLDEVQVSLRRVIKHGDFAFEPLYNVLSV